MGGTGLVCRVIKLRNSDSRDSLPLSKSDFWHKTAEGQKQHRASVISHSQVFLHENVLSVAFLTAVKYHMLQTPTTSVTKRLLKRIK